MARPHLPLQVLKIALAQECIWFIRCGLWRKQGWSRITRKWVSLPWAQEQICADKQDVSNRNILFLLRRSLPGPQWCHTKTWNRRKEENTIVLFILWFPLIRSRTSPTEMLSDRLMFVFEVLQYFGFWKKHLFFFNTNLNVFLFVFFYGGLMSIWSHFQSNKEWITDCLIWWWNTHNRRWPSGRAGSTVSLYAFRSYHSPRFRAKKTTTKKLKTPLDQKEVVVPHTLTHIYTGQVLNASLKHSIMTS